MANGVYASVTEGVSMRPLFRTHRDMVILAPPSGKLQKYDVALYRVGEKYVLHRVVGYDKENDLYLIRGDNTYSLERVKPSAVIAKLIAFNRKGKRYEISDFSYRLYSKVWVAIYPLRHFFKKIEWFLRGLLRKLFKRK